MGKEENDESEKIWTMMTCRCNWPVGSPHPHYTVYYYYYYYYYYYNYYYYYYY